MGGCWFHDTLQGTFRIEHGRVLQRECFIVLYEDQPLGCCESAYEALERLTTGQVYPPSCGLKIAPLHLPRDLTQWTYAPQPVPTSLTLWSSRGG